MTFRTTIRTVLALTLLTGVTLTGCTQEQKPPEPPPPPARIVSFATTASTVDVGSPVTLSWETKDAVTVELKDATKGVPSGFDGQKSGSLEVPVTEDSLFVLTATNARGVRDSAAVAVQVREGAKNVVFIASPGTVTGGESSVLAWTAQGAREVSLKSADGAELDLGGQKESGSVKVTPAVSTVYQLTVDGEVHDQQVAVRPNVFNFVANAEGVKPGEDITLSWQIVGAATVKVTRLGHGQLVEETDAAKIADGSFTETMPADAAQGVAFTYVLRAEAANAEVFTERTVTVYVAGEPQVLDWKVPDYAPVNGTFQLSWKTQAATAVELLQDGTVIYVSPTVALAASGSLQLSTPAKLATYRLRALDGRGGVALSDEETVDPVGIPSVSSFSATPQPGIANGGDPVTLSWDIPSGRHLKIVAQGQYVVAEINGTGAENGSLVTYPNKDTTYELVADNGIGDVTDPATADVTVTTPAKLIINPPSAPAGAPITVTGHTVAGGGDVVGLPVVTKNAPGDAFFDISSVGTNTNFGGYDTGNQVYTLPRPFVGRVFGQPVSATQINIATNGWFAFTSTSTTGPDYVTAPLPSTALVPFAIAPHWDDLINNGAAVYVHFDGEGDSERFIIQWDGFELDGSSGSDLTFQAQVYTNGKIVFAYQNLSVPTSPSCGVVNGDETDAVVLPAAPQTGDVYTFFGQASLPVTMKAPTNPFTSRVLIGNSFIEIETAFPVIKPGDVDIVEMNVNPAVADGQWFELLNKTASPIDLNGWTLDFGGGNTHVIGSALVVPANGRAVLAQAPGANDGLTVDYVWGTTQALTAGQSMKLTVLTTAFATFAIPSASQPQGYSLQRDPIPTGMVAASGATGIDCPASAASAYGTNGQFGTPGAANTPCVVLTYQGTGPGNFESIKLTGTKFSYFDTDASVMPLNTGTPFNIDGATYNTLYVGTNGWISRTAITCSGYPCYDSGKSTPSSSAPVGMIAPFWGDLDHTLSTGGVWWQRKVPGLTPNDGYTIVSWENVRRYGSSGDNLNFQVKLFDDGRVEFHFGTLTGTNGGSTVTWIEHLSGRAAWRINAYSSSPGIQTNTAYLFQP